MIAVLFISFLVLLILGVPIAFCTAISSLLSLLVGMPNAIITIPAKMFGGLDSFSLMAIPLFILSGNLMEVGGVSRRLVNFAQLLVGWIKGGLGMVAVVASMIFASISGSAAATTSAIGAMMVPSMVDAGYQKEWSACCVAAGGVVGPIIPPSVLVILYCAATGLSVGAMFIAGAIPGILMGLFMMVICYRYGAKHPETGQYAREAITTKYVINTIVGAIPAMVMPLIIIGGILSGAFTPTEAAAVACVYSVLVGLFLYRGMNLQQLWDILANSAFTSAKLMFIVSSANLFGWIMSKEQFPQTVANTLTSMTDSNTVIMILIILVLMFVGCFMETTAALVILTPVLYPIGQQFGFDPIHFGIVIIVMLVIGAITPPVGVLVYIGASIAKTSFTKCIPYLFPFFAALMLAGLLTAFWPPLTTWLPAAMGF
ncbi:MAG: TRAP transporter large permease [Eubacteriales bacterium]|jgi:C4-dicarboxylate transporter DctM subunit